MSGDLSLGPVVRSEWIKFRTVRSTLTGVFVMFVLTIGLGALIAWATRSHFHTLSGPEQLTFDPVSTSLIGVVFSQFAIGVIGTLLITSEYASGLIRTTLGAVPKRILLVSGKLVVLITSMFVVTEIACFAAFFVGQRIFLGAVPTASLTSNSVLRAVVFAGVYLTLLSVVSFSLGLIIRHSAAAIGIFVSIVLILPLLSLALPQSWRDHIVKFEPSELGNAMTSVVTPSGDMSALSSLVMLVIYAAVVLVIGTLLFQRRDA
ncbi:MAG TPA: ABC transporter permease subunit [Acidimicrobiales bacterium]|nr:ABC transporter permease subunit [Acidimicrobiales bacterium]